MAESTGSPLTSNVTVGFRRVKKPKLTSYRPGAAQPMTARSFSHPKLSGLVLMFCTFHGTRCFSPLVRPDFQIHRPGQGQGWGWGWG
jgi:hypothetical protein